MDEKPIALVTGANKGLGKEVARQLGKRGLRVYLGSRNWTRGGETAGELIAEGLDVVPAQIDVTSDESVTALATELQRRHGRLDVLVNNAGALVSRPASAITSAYV